MLVVTNGYTSYDSYAAGIWPVFESQRAGGSGHRALDRDKKWTGREQARDKKAGQIRSVAANFFQQVEI